MQAYTAPILIAGGICFILASSLTIPFAILQYRKYGFFSFWKAVLIFSFIFYALSAYFLVIYPVPVHWDNCGDMNPGAALTQTQPFHFTEDIRRETAFRWSVPSSYIELIKAPSFYTRAFNVLLLFPLGVYLRYFFKKKRKWIYGALIAFGVSLFFELTQRTALYGLFKCPYRIFDVDDLIANTAGAVLGFFMAPIFLWLIPSRAELTDQMRYYDNRRHATYGAQLFEVMITIVVTKFIASFISGIPYVSNVLSDDIVFLIIFFVMMVVIPTVWNGQTLGGKIIRVKLSSQKGNHFSAFHRRFWIVYFPFMLSAISGGALAVQMSDNLYLNLIGIGLFFLNALVWMIYFGHIVIRWMNHDKAPFFNRYGRVEALRVGRGKTE